MENQTPFLFENLDIRISKISNGEEEIKVSNEDRNISSCNSKSKPQRAREHIDKVYNCDQCTFIAKDKLRLKEHHDTTHSKKKYREYTCDYCEKVFKHEHPKAVRHAKRPHDHKCEKCDKAFIYSNQLKKHIKANHPRSHKCEKCDKAFIYSIQLKKHIKANHPRSHKCEKCDKAFIYSIQLKKHIKANHPRSHKCEKCDKAFINSIQLKKHIKANHPRSHDHKCEKCDKAFIYNIQLKKHIKANHPIIQEPKLYTKTKDGRYSCINCNKQFCSSNSAIRHYRKEHLDIFYDCTHCNYSSKDKNHLKNHIKIHHSGNKFTCKYCQHTFLQEYSHKEHLTKAHNFECSQCDKAFVRNDQLQLHIKIDHEGKETSHHCKICNKMVLHLKEHNYSIHREIEVDRTKCLKCKSEFKTKGLLKKHKCIKPIIRYY